jgi:hypothetical protein
MALGDQTVASYIIGIGAIVKEKFCSAMMDADIGKVKLKKN